MSAQSIRDQYRVPAKRGARIRYTGSGSPQDGTIVAFDREGAYLRVRFDGEKRVLKLHPTWRVEYLPVAAP